MPALLGLLCVAIVTIFVAEFLPSEGDKGTLMNSFISLAKAVLVTAGGITSNVVAAAAPG